MMCNSASGSAVAMLSSDDADSIFIKVVNNVGEVEELSIKVGRRDREETVRLVNDLAEAARYSASSSCNRQVNFRRVTLRA